MGQSMSVGDVIRGELPDKVYDRNYAAIWQQDNQPWLYQGVLQEYSEAEDKNTFTLVSKEKGWWKISFTDILGGVKREIYVKEKDIKEFEKILPDAPDEEQDVVESGWTPASGGGGRKKVTLSRSRKKRNKKRRSKKKKRTKKKSFKPCQGI